MSRPRKKDKHLPAYVRVKNGAYHYRGQKLCRVSDGESAMYEALAKRKSVSDLGHIPEAVAAFKLHYLPGLSPSSRNEHRRLLNVFSDEFAEFRVSDVTAVNAKRSIRNLYGDKLSAARAYQSRISTFFSWCVTEEGLRADNPCREIRTKKPPKRKTKWTDELFWSVRERLAPMMRCYHDLSFLLYQRTTDVRHLMRSQIRDGVIRFAPSKTEDSSAATVDVPITPAICAALERAEKLAKLQAGPGGDAPVIQTSDGCTCTRSGIYSAYLRADKAIHGEVTPIGLNPKALRPYAATSASRQGFTKDQLQVGLAHTSVRTAEGYIHQHETPVSQVTLVLPEKSGKGQQFCPLP